MLPLVITRIAVSLGARMGLVDKPDARKLHQGDVPLAGGIAIFRYAVVWHLCAGYRALYLSDAAYRLRGVCGRGI